MPTKFKGRYYNKNVLYTWTPYIPLTYGPIDYLEIGVADGGNAIHVANTYCKHPDSKIYCVDPWEDYDEYSEYKGDQDIGWNTFQTNIRNSGSFDKFIVNKGLSDYIVPKFADNFFDIIYVDGNHQEDYVYRDGVMALNKCKPGGYIVFDDYAPGYWEQTIRGIDRFQQDYKDHIEIVGKKTEALQSIVRKK
jgi:predicted O-methyltransferase YrrM